jgi:hypothetical protein
MEPFSLFGWLVADGWCSFVLREEYCWLVAGGWFVLTEKYCWLVAQANERNALPFCPSWPCLNTPAVLELELVSNSSSSPKLTLALEVFGSKG